MASESALASSPVGLVAYDRQGNVTSATGPPVRDRLTRSGLDEASAVGVPIAQLWPDVEAAVSRATIESLLGDPRTLEIDDEGRSMALLFRPAFDDEPQPVGGVCTVIDVTSLQARRLLGTSAEDVLVRFASGLSRVVEEIAQSTADLVADAEEARSPLSEEAEAINRQLAALATDLNAYSGRLAKRPAALAINRWIVEFAGGVIADLPDGVSLVVETPGGDVRVTIDEWEFDYVLTALVERARQALGTHGLLTVAVETPPDDERDPAAPFGHARVSVIDTGAPIPIESRDSLTLPFDRSAGGSLTLAAVRRVVARANGRLSVFSGPNATFVEIDFPLMTERGGGQR